MLSKRKVTKKVSLKGQLEAFISARYNSSCMIINDRIVVPLKNKIVLIFQLPVIQDSSKAVLT